MNEILNKISSYNLFNYLFSGVVFVIICDMTTSYNFIQKDPINGIFLYYFIGLFISRLGSIIIEPFLKWSKFVKIANYKDFVLVSKEDSKMDVLSESNNMYRTLISVFLLLIIFNIYTEIELKYQINNQIIIYGLLISLLITFLFAYKKQTLYITNRIKNHLNIKK